MNNHKVKCSNFEIANNKPFTLIAGPCQLETEEHALKISNELKKITSELGINLIYKTSFSFQTCSISFIKRSFVNKINT